MKKIVLIALLALGSVLYSQNNLEQILGISGLRKFVNDSCECKSVIISHYQYSFFGLRRTERIGKKKYKNGILINNNDYQIKYDSAYSFIRKLVNSPKIVEKLDTSIKVFFDYGNPDGKKGGPYRDYNAIFEIRKGLIVSKIFLNNNYKLFFKYNLNNKLMMVYSLSKNNEKVILQEFEYDSNNNLQVFIWRNMFDGIEEIHSLKKYYNMKGQVVKRQMFEYGELYQTLFFEYNAQGLETKETYFDKNGNWDSSYETIYNERGQEFEVYKLNKKGKQKRLITSYEYVY